MRLRFVALRYALLLIPVAMLAAASGARAEPLYNKRVYSPDAKSYFELVRVGKGHSLRGADIAAVNWANARKLAYARAFKGVRGRLAVVKSRAVNDFLRKTFRPDEKAWIGLRYWCAYNRLQWVTGEFYAVTEYANWDRTWRHDGGTRPRGKGKKPSCNQFFRFWPVHYWPVQEAFRWNANGQQKDARSFFVEYPTGKE